MYMYLLELRRNPSFLLFFYSSGIDEHDEHVPVLTNVRAVFT